MAITHNLSAGQAFTAVTSASFNVIVGAGENIAALIGLSWQALLEAETASVTFGGTTATFIQLVQNSGGVVEQYYVVGTAPGSRVVQAVWAGGSVDVILGIEVMNGVDQTIPLGAIGTAHGDPASGVATVTLAATLADSWLVDTSLTPRPTPSSLTPDASQTLRWSETASVSPTQIIGAGSSRLSGGGSQSMTWTVIPDRNWDLAVAEFKAAITAPVVGIGGYTSYTYGDDPTPLESFRPPEEQQRVWVNDRRFMQGQP